MMDQPAVNEAFADTCVLISFVQQEFEQTAAPELIECDDIELIVSEAILDEFENVTNRRDEIYVDLIDFLLAEEGTIETYDPATRHVYVGENDWEHLRDLQMTLSQFDDQRVKKRLRRYLKAVERRVQYIKDEFTEDVAVPQASMLLELAIARLIDNDADATVIANAAGWTANGGSGVLVTLDSQDFIENEHEVAELLREEKGPEWVITMCFPQDLLAEHR